MVFLCLIASHRRFMASQCCPTLVCTTVAKHIELESRCAQSDLVCKLSVDWLIFVNHTSRLNLVTTRFNWLFRTRLWHMCMPWYVCNLGYYNQCTRIHTSLTIQLVLNELAMQSCICAIKVLLHLYQPCILSFLFITWDLSSFHAGSVKNFLKNPYDTVSINFKIIQQEKTPDLHTFQTWNPAISVKNTIFYNPSTVSYTHLDVYKRQSYVCTIYLRFLSVFH